MSNVVAEADSEATFIGASSREWARFAFYAYLGISVPVLMAIGAGRWFLSDEWSFLTSRSATSVHDLLAPNNQHWSTIPVLVYRALYGVFGLREYWPYQLVAILTHLAIAALLRHLMRRSGVRPWIATVVAGTYVLFGPGADDILWAFQLGFNLSVAFALGQMIAADHPGPIDRRDGIAVGLGFLALLCSGVAPAIILATGIAVLWRRGWRPALLQTVPLGALYLAWYVVEGAGLHDLITQRARLFVGLPGTTISAQGAHTVALSVSAFLHFVWTGTYSLFRALTHFTPAGIALAGVLLGGLVVAWSSADRPRRLALPGALLVGCMVSVAAAAPQRAWSGPDAAAASRYVGVTAALALPAIAVAIDSLARRWRGATAALALVLIAVPWNISSLHDSGLPQGYFDGLEAWVASVPYYPGISNVPSWVEPNDTILGTPDLRVGWLRQAATAGKLPPKAQLNAFTAGDLPIQLGVAQRGGKAPKLTCRTYSAPLAVDPPLGTVWRLRTPMTVQLRSGKRPVSFPMAFSPVPGQDLIEITLPNLHLLLAPGPKGHLFELCR